MADENPRADEVTNLTPEQVAAGVREGRILLVDVREPNETAVESYPEAVVVPLSCFDPTAIPDPEGAWRRAQARAAVRHHVDVVLPFAPRAAAGAAFGHAALAGPSVHHAGALCQ